MNRESVADGSGMWFDFSDTGMDKYPFWMKDTLVDLDWIYVDDGMKVVAVKANNKAKDETKFAPDVPFVYVLEVKSGVADKLGVKLGDVVAFGVGPK